MVTPWRTLLSARGFDQQAQLAVGVRIDEARRQCEAVEIHDACARGREAPAHGGDAAAGQRDVRLDRRRARPVVDDGAAEHHVGGARPQGAPERVRRERRAARRQPGGPEERPAPHHRPRSMR